jgi:anti-anti-sigma factor
LVYFRLREAIGWAEIVSPDPCCDHGALTQRGRALTLAIGDIPLTFSATTDRSNSLSVRLDLAGELHGPAVVQLRLMLLEALVEGSPDELIIDLDAVVCLSTGGLAALIDGYIDAVEYGTSYRVLNAHGKVHEAMRTTGTLDMLADSDDTGALLAALLLGDSST